MKEKEQHEGLMKDQADSGQADTFPWMLVSLGFAFLTFNSGMAIYRSDGSFAAVGFVVLLCMDLVLLFRCLRCYERAAPGSPMWVLTALLISVYSNKITAVMAQMVRIFMWAVAAAAATELGGFYAFFLHREEETKDDVDAAFRNNRRVRITQWQGSVLSPLRRFSPRRAGLSGAHGPSDIAWSIARLILDSGATSHAVGNIWLLEGFQPYNPPLSATLADGRNLRILGIGRIERGSFSIPNVQLVEGLQDGLISVRQLDAEHRLISCFGNGICKIMLADGTEVGGAFVQGDDGLYVLRYLEVPGPSEE